MKQRLLISLLMLFVSVGILKAEIVIKVPKDGTLKIEIPDGSNESGKQAKVYVGGVDKQTFWPNVKSYTVNKAGTEQEVKISGVFKTLTLTGKATYLSIGKDELVTLNASGLGLETLKFEKAPALKTVNVSGNKELTTIEGTMLASIVDFNASDCGLTSFPSAAENATTLTKLNLSGNKLSGNGLDFSSYAALKELDLSNNNLTGLTVAQSLEKLNISNNQILRVDGIGQNTKTTVGKQEIKSSIAKKANEGLNMATAWNMNFGKPSFSENDWLNIKESDIVWEKLGNGSTYSKVDHGQRGRGDSAPATFYFYSPSEGNVFQSGTYRVTIKYNGAEMVISNITINPAEFKLNIANEFIKVTKSQGTVINNGTTVKQGDILIASVNREGHELDKFIPTALVEEPKSSIDENHIAFRVAGSWDEAGLKEIAPKIDAKLKDKLLTVIMDSNVEGETNSVSVIAQKEGKTIHLKSKGETSDIPYQSKLVITLKADVGYEPQLTVDGEKVEPTLKEGSTTEYEYVIPELVKDNFRIVANVVKISKVSLSLKFEGELTAIGGSTFAPNSVIWINDKEYSASVTKNSFVPGTKATLKFYLTKCAVEGTDDHAGKPIEIEQILYGTTPIPFDKKNVTEPTNNSQAKYNAARQYTASFEVLPTGGTITIVTKVAPNVTILPKKTEGISKNVQVYTYDGNPKAFEYTTNPAKFAEDVKVQYKLGSNDFTDKQPVDAGEWTVRYWMEATTEHQAVTAKEDWKIKIKKAVPEITTVPKVDVQNGKYVITGGEVKFNGQTLANGYFRVVTKSGSQWVEVNKQETTQTKAHMVNVRYTATVSESGAADQNFESPVVSTTATVNGEGEVEQYAVSCEGMADSEFGIELFNGDLPLKNNDKVPSGATVKVRLTVPLNYNMSKVKLYAGTTEITDKESLQGDGERILIFTTTIKKPTVFTVKADASFELNKEFTVTVRTYETVYDGTEKAYPVNKDYLVILWDNKPSSQVENVVNLKPEFSYAKVVNGTEIPVTIPEDAGEYKVYVTIPYQGQQSDWNEYKESKNNVGKMIIKEAETIIVTAPKPTLIPNGQTLAQSNLLDGLAKVKNIDGKAGDKTIAGTFKWDDSVINTVPENGKAYKVVFVPENPSYASSSTTVKITVSDKNLITIKDPGAQVGTIIVTDAVTGERYYGEEEIVPGTQLRIQVTSTADFEFDCLLINGERISQSNYLYTVGNSSVAISAEFHVIKEDPEIDPSTQYAVTVSKSGRGFTVTNEGVNAVKIEGSFSFSVKALAADMKKVVVKANGKALDGKNGVYTIEKVLENTSIVVTLPNPTELKVDIETEYENKDGFKTGTVIVEGTADGKYYYNDMITVIAYPESGTEFDKWSDGSKEQVREIVLTKDVTLEAVFTGNPVTGIEDIESAKVYGSEGCVMVRGIADAEITIVNMNGRLQTKRQISGDTRIDAPRGIYVVVLESGSDVKRVKVVVK